MDIFIEEMNYFDFESRKEEKMSSWLTVIWLQIKKAYFLLGLRRGWEDPKYRNRLRKLGLLILEREGGDLLEERL